MLGCGNNSRKIWATSPQLFDPELSTRFLLGKRAGFPGGRHPEGRTAAPRFPAAFRGCKQTLENSVTHVQPSYDRIEIDDLPVPAESVVPVQMDG
jgi:hypothetical protein